MYEKRVGVRCRVRVEIILVTVGSGLFKYYVIQFGGGGGHR